jgi:hypothetical protein
MHTHATAPTQFVEANGIRFADRRFGCTGAAPIVLNQHFTGTMDHWDHPDANHGPMYQYPELFLAHVALFLDA